MRATDECGRRLFKTIEISLVCDDCLRTEHPEKCNHRQSSLPRWLSSKRVDMLRTLMESDSAMFLRETLGVSVDGSQKCFRLDDLEAFFSRKPDSISRNARQPTLNVDHIIIAVDPCGGGSSAFSICSVIMTHAGAYQASLSASLLRCQCLPTWSVAHKLRSRMPRDSARCRGCRRARVEEALALRDLQSGQGLSSGSIAVRPAPSKWRRATWPSWP